MEKTPGFASQEPQPGGLIHPDFTIPNNRFFQNQVWDGIIAEGTGPDIKAGFSFDNIRLLDDCPFVAKVSYDVAGEFAYFGVAYGLRTQKDELTEWAKKFPSAKLFTFNGSFIERIRG